MIEKDKQIKTKESLFLVSPHGHFLPILSTLHP